MQSKYPRNDESTSDTKCYSPYGKKITFGSTHEHFSLLSAAHVTIHSAVDYLNKWCDTRLLLPHTYNIADLVRRN